MHTDTPTLVGRVRREGKQWVIEAPPYLLMRIKRHFPRVSEQATSISVLATNEVSRDLEWMLLRWPMELGESDAALLLKEADAHRDAEASLTRILRGDRTPPLLFEMKPIRAAREYQEVAAALIRKTGRLLLMDMLGLGKTMTAILILAAHDALPALIVVPTHLPLQWMREIDATFPHLRVHNICKGTPYEIPDPPHVYLCNYAKLSRGWGAWLSGKVNTVIFDEVQELRRDHTLKYVEATRVAHPARYRIGLSATPVYNYGGEIHTVLQVLAPDALGTRQEFVQEWGWNSGNHVHVKDPGALSHYLRSQGLILRRTRKEVGQELPPVNIIQHWIDTDDKLFHNIIQRENLSAIAHQLLESLDHTERFKSAGELDWRLRRATGLAKAEYVADFCKMLLDSEERIILFGWHHDVYHIWLKRLSAYHPVLYTGSENPKQKEAALERFSKHSRILIISLRSGAGIDGLQKICSTCVFGELDWSPSVIRQDIGRLDRPGQEDVVTAIFLNALQGSDPYISEVLGIKSGQSLPIEDPDAPTVQPVNTNRMAELAKRFLEGK